MKTLLLAAGFAVLFTAPAFAYDVYHRGYFNSYGTYVAPHYQTAPDNTRLNNYSTYPNVNPYTGRMGTLPAYPTVPTMPRLRPYGVQ